MVSAGSAEIFGLVAVKSEDDMSGEIYYEGISPLKGINK